MEALGGLKSCSAAREAYGELVVVLFQPRGSYPIASDIEPDGCVREKHRGNQEQLRLEYK